MNGQQAEPTDSVEAILEQQLKAWRNVRRGAGTMIKQIEDELARLRRGK